MTLAKHTFNVFEKRIIYRILEALQEKMGRHVIVKDLFGGEQIIVEISTKSLLTKNSSNRKHIYDALKRLKKISFDAVGKDKKGVYKKDVSIIADFKQYQRNEMIEIKIEELMAPFFLEKAKGFTPYNLEVSFNSSSAYTMKIYELLCQWRQKGLKVNQKWSMNYLSDYFNVPESYKRYSKFAEKILEPARKELNSNPGTDVRFEYKGIKKGRRIEFVTFTIIDETKTDIAPEDVADTIIANARMRALLTKHFKFKEQDFIDIKEALEKPELEYQIFEIMADVNTRIENGEVKYPKAYIKKSILQLL